MNFRLGDIVSYNNKHLNVIEVGVVTMLSPTGWPVLVTIYKTGIVKGYKENELELIERPDPNHYFKELLNPNNLLKEIL